MNLRAQDAGAVIVTFNPDTAFFDRLTNIAGQTSATVVVDNGSTLEFAGQLRAAAAADARIAVIGFETNQGIAAALNAGLDHLTASGFTWGYTFDHDSLPQENFFCAMGEAIGLHAGVALLAPEYMDEASRTSITPTVGNDAKGGVDILSTMTSGNLVHLPTWQTVGKFDERYFIDYVDHEFCLRLKARGYRIVQVAGAVLAHNLGDRSTHGLTARKFSTTNHSALRRYYITRNRLRVYATYLPVFPRWVLNDMRSAIKETAKIVFFEQQKIRKVRAMALGVRDAVTGRWPRYKE
jgi:rhamnosyltransferase